MTRPNGLSPLPASEDNYPTGAPPWSSTPTKVDPGLFAISQGFVPDARLYAQIVNWIFNQYGIWIEYQDRLEVKNFRSMGSEEFTSGGHKVKISNARNVILYNAPLGKYFFAGRRADDEEIPTVHSSATGAKNDWITTTPPVKPTTGPNQTYQIDVDDTGRLIAWLTKSGTSYFAFRTAAGVWGSFSVNQPTIQAYVSTFFLGKWCVGGVVSNVPSIYTATSADVWVAQTLSGAAATAAIVDMATTSTRIVALSSEGHTWTTDALNVTWLHTDVSAFDSQPTGVVAIEGEGFFLLCADGQVYNSTNGTTWTKVQNTTVFFPGATNVGWAGCAACGGVIVAASQIDTPEGPSQIGAMTLIWNGGKKWETLPAPISGPIATSSPFQAVTFIDDRIALVREDGGASNGVGVAYGLRT